MGEQELKQRRRYTSREKLSRTRKWMVLGDTARELNSVHL